MNKIIVFLFFMPFLAVSQNIIPRPKIFNGLDEKNGNSLLNMYCEIFPKAEQSDRLVAEFIGTHNDISNDFSRYDASYDVKSGVSFKNDPDAQSASIFQYMAATPEGIYDSHGVFFWGLLPYDANNNNKVPEYTVAGWFYKGGGALDKYKHLFAGRSTNFKSIFALKLLDESLSINRQIANGESVDNYNYDLGKEVSLDEGNGWYFVALAQTEFVTRVFTGKPSGAFECKYLFVGQQDYQHANKWSIGASYRKNAPYSFSIDGCDDFMVWDQKLSKDQLLTLFNCSKNKDPNDSQNPCWGIVVPKSQASARVINQQENDEVLDTLVMADNINPELVVFPNPTKNGNITVQFHLAEDSPVELVIHDMSGNLILKKTYDVLSSGTQQIKINHLMPECNCMKSTGIYLVRLRSDQSEKVVKVVVL